MIKTVDELKQKRPDLVELFEGMTHEELLNQIYLEAKDALNMEERVEVFMELCTCDMSKTTYPPSFIRELVEYKQEKDISDFCEMVLEDTEGMDLEEMREYLREEIID